MNIKEVTKNMILGMIVLGGGDHNSTSYDRSKNRPMGRDVEFHKKT